MYFKLFSKLNSIRFFKSRLYLCLTVPIYRFIVNLRRKLWEKIKIYVEINEDLAKAIYSEFAVENESATIM